MSGFIIMIPNNADTRDSHRAADVGGELLRFFGKSVLCEVAAEQQHIGAARNLGKRIVHLSARMLGIMKIRGRSDTQRWFCHRFKKRNGD